MSRKVKNDKRKGPALWLAVPSLALLAGAIVFFAVHSNRYEPRSRAFAADASPSPNVAASPVAAKVTEGPAPMPGTKATYSVKSFGAVGNGVANDTVAVQKALAAVSKAKGILYFPKGVYLIEAAKGITVKSNVKIMGDGPAKSVLKAYGKSFASTLLTVSGTNVTVSQIALDGANIVNRVLFVQSGSSAVKIMKSNVGYAAHLNDWEAFHDHPVVAGILVYGNSSDVSIDQTEIHHVKASMQIDGSLISRGVYITSSPDTDEAVGRRISVTNSFIHDIGPADDGDGIYYEDLRLDDGGSESSNGLISGNVFENCAKRAIKLYANGIIVKANKIRNGYLNDNWYEGRKNDGKSPPDMYAGISVYGNDISLLDNVLEGVGSYYAAIEVTSDKTVRNIVIKGNKIAMGQDSEQSGKTAIRVGNVDGFDISGNVLTGGEKGIWTWQNAANGTIADNRITNPAGGGISLRTYVADVSVTDVRLTGNVIAARDYGIDLDRERSENVTIVEPASEDSAASPAA